MNETYIFFKEKTKVNFVSTVNGDKPRCRPFGDPILFDNKIYVITNKQKNVSKQIAENNNVCIVAYDNENWSKLLKYYLDLGLINENTTIIGHSIAPIFISKFLVENKLKVKKLIFVCGFNNYLGINEEYDNVNETMYFDNLEDIKQYANEIICFYSDNDPYVTYEVEKDFADTVATEQVLIPNAGHINSESGYDIFEDIVTYL